MEPSCRAEVFRYAAEQYGIEPEYPWARLPDHAVLRRQDNRKWFALLMPVGRDKLGLTGDGTVDVLNVKCDPLLTGALRREPGILPAYHMNKDKWISVLLDGAVPQEEIFHLIDLSYQLTGSAKRKK